MSVRRASGGRLKAAIVLILAGLWGLLLAGCGSEVSAEPRALLITPHDIRSDFVSVLSLSEEQSLAGPSAQIELQAYGFRVVQSLIIYETREQALAALDGIRADLVNRGEATPGGPEASGIFEHHLGEEEAASLFFIENRGLVRLTATGPDRGRHLAELATVARKKLAGD